MSIELLNMNCMEYMATLPDKAFDLAIVDPPYGIERFKRGSIRFAKDNKHANGISWDVKPENNYFVELKRISVNQIIWGANHFWAGNLDNATNFIFWDKQQVVANFADGEIAWTSFPGVAKKFVYAWGGLSDGVLGRNKTEKSIHPTQKPVKLYEWLLTNYAKPGQRILDTHLGSGSSAIAAYNLGFDFVGMELDADYYAAACKRFEQHKAQGSLFVPDTVRDAYEQTDLLYRSEHGA